MLYDTMTDDNKRRKSPAISVTISMENYRYLIERAEKENRTRSNMLDCLLTKIREGE